MSNRLPALAADLVVLKGEIEQHEAAVAEKALQAGRLLIEAKKLAGHGSWGGFLAKTGIRERTAQRYMRLAESGMKSATVADLGGIAAADRFLRWHRAEGLDRFAPEDVAQTIIKGRIGVDAIKAAEDAIKAAEQEVAEGWWQFGNALNEARKELADVDALCEWAQAMGLDQFSGRKLTRVEMDYAMAFARNPEAFAHALPRALRDGEV